LGGRDDQNVKTGKFDIVKAVTYRLEDMDRMDALRIKQGISMIEGWAGESLQVYAAHRLEKTTQRYISVRLFYGAKFCTRACFLVENRPRSASDFG
jgi:hypothetical protein